MVSEEEKPKGPKRRADDDDDDCMTTIGKLPRVERNFETSSLLAKLSRGEKIDLDSLDGIGEVEEGAGNRTRYRTTSEYVPTKINIEADKNRSLPTTPTFPIASQRRRNLSLSDIPLSRNRSLLGSFTENALTGRLEPVKTLEGFNLQLTASGSSFSSNHLNLPVTVHYFDLNTTGCQYFQSAPVPYLGKCDLPTDYRIPSKGVLQATLFNPQSTVVKMFLTNYDVENMPPNSKTFIRHVWEWKVNNMEKSKHLQYLIHFRLQSDRRSRVHLHSDIRILFSQDSTRDAFLLPQFSSSSSSSSYQLIDHIEIPKYSRK